MNSAPFFSMAQATLSRRPATDRRARPWLCPRPRSAAYLVLLGASCCNGDARPVVHGVSEPVTAGLPSDDNAALAGLLGDGRDSGQTAQSGVVAPFKAVPSLCEQRGEDNPSNSRQGRKDFHVMLLLPPRPCLLCWNEPGRQGIQPAMSLFDLPVHKADARNERL